jgi:hypothetical protein
MGSAVADAPRSQGALDAEAGHEIVEQIRAARVQALVEGSGNSFSICGYSW